tara:strand:+ start:833 stop:1219 length:387 start_codon:yes stop_codon:yes gene_type:complete
VVKDAVGRFLRTIPVPEMAPPVMPANTVSNMPFTVNVPPASTVIASVGTVTEGVSVGTSTEGVSVGTSTEGVPSLVRKGGDISIPVPGTAPGVTFAVIELTPGVTFAVIELEPGVTLAVISPISLHPS